MAKRKSRGSAPDGAVSVTGPDYERDGLPNLSVGISAAQTAASRAGQDGTWYVRLGDTIRYWVERRDDVISVTIPAREVK